MAMQSEQIGALAKSLASAQAELSPAIKNSQNPHLHNKYADITAVYEAIRSVLPKHGLAVVQGMVPYDKGYVCVRTTLMHESGEWIASELAMPLPTMGNNPPQQMGSAITYARRYSLSAIVGVVSEDDDDADCCDNKRIQKQQVQQVRQEAKANNPAPATNKQRAKMFAILKSQGKDSREAGLKELSNFLGRELKTTNEMTDEEVMSYIESCENVSVEEAI